VRHDNVPPARLVRADRGESVTTNWLASSVQKLPSKRSGLGARGERGRRPEKCLAIGRIMSRKEMSDTGGRRKADRATKARDKREAKRLNREARKKMRDVPGHQEPTVPPNPRAKPQW
jgi:hypothetical protein